MKDKSYIQKCMVCIRIPCRLWSREFPMLIIAVKCDAHTNVLEYFQHLAPANNMKILGGSTFPLPH